MDPKLLPQRNFFALNHAGEHFKVAGPLMLVALAVAIA